MNEVQEPFDQYSNAVQRPEHQEKATQLETQAANRGIVSRGRIRQQWEKAEVGPRYEKLRKQVPVDSVSGIIEEAHSWNGVAAYAEIRQVRDPLCCLPQDMKTCNNLLLGKIPMFKVHDIPVPEFMATAEGV